MGLRADSFKAVDNYIILQEKRVFAVFMELLQNDTRTPMAQMMSMADEIGRMTSDVVDCVLSQREWFNQTASIADHFWSHKWKEDADVRVSRFCKKCREELDAGLKHFAITDSRQVQTVYAIFQFKADESERRLDQELARLVAERHSVDKKGVVAFMRNPLSHLFTLVAGVIGGWLLHHL